jgi:uncharacterized protein with ParB-like and HNH nuclease domain
MTFKQLSSDFKEKKKPFFDTINAASINCINHSIISYSYTEKYAVDLYYKLLYTTFWIWKTHKLTTLKHAKS